MWKYRFVILQMKNKLEKYKHKKIMYIIRVYCKLIFIRSNFISRLTVNKLVHDD